MTQLPNNRNVLLLQRKWAGVRSIHDAQRLYIRNEISQVHGLVEILMKRRNGGRWTDGERVILQRNLRALSNLSPYLLPLILPGGVLMLPLLAWWLDCRRKARKDKAESA